MKAIFPVLTWLVWVILLGPLFRQNQWECLLVMFAAIELLPKGLQLLGLPQKEWYAALAAGFCAAYFFEGYWYLALPYLLWGLWNTLKALTEGLFLNKRTLLDLLRLFALGFWTTGAAFAVFFLADIHPLNFDPVIVSLTAAHFHVAGFALTVIVYALNQQDSSPINKILAWSAMAGMPLVAIGIVLSKLGFPTALEQVAALAFVLFALFVTRQQIRLSFASTYSVAARRLWMAGAICLLLGLTLAGVYALRFQFPIEWVSIPNMKIWHGTLNTLGFAWLSLSGYLFATQKPLLHAASH